MQLQTYNQKRDFKKTPEPAGNNKKESSKGLRFVVQKHNASHLHYDFRLEAEGVLKSWAVPKGPSLDPKNKRLAMMTEDHPLSYRKFEGVIPEGNYGAGEVIVWDTGTYSSEEGEKDKSAAERKIIEGIKKGKVEFFLKGEKLKGNFVLTKTPATRNSWLLIKKNDEYSNQRDVTRDEYSVLTGKTLNDLGAKEKVSEFLSFGKKSPMPHLISPMLATLTNKPFDDKDWIFEIKWDGYRGIAELRKNKVDLYTRNHISLIPRFPSIHKALVDMDLREAIFDGEIVVLDQKGVPRFELLQRHIRTGEGTPIYMVFDLLFLNGRDLRGVPLIKRKLMLERAIRDNPSKSILYSSFIERSGVAMFEEAKKIGLEGIMAKRSDSLYAAQRSNSWLKIKTKFREEAVIAGFTAPKGSRKELGALILAQYKNGELTYIGHTGGGFNSKLLKEVKDKLLPLRMNRSPFAKPPKTNSPATWVKPKLVCEIEFANWTQDGIMRQPIFLGLRDDKSAQDIEGEQEMHKAEISNPNKVFWPREGYKKSDLINYYKEVSELVLPYVNDRPQSLHRFPNGIRGKSFFQKNFVSNPGWIKTIPIKSDSEERTINYSVIDNEESLLYFANLGCIELNPWNSKIQQLDHPDYAVIDLDPGEIEFEEVIKVAQEARKILNRMGIEGYPKTSGKTGLHIYIPLGAKYTHEEAKQFVKIICTLIHRNLPGTTSLERSPSKRTDKIYLDFLQNRWGQTMAAAYSLRPHPGATVSMPLTWSEVRKGLDPSAFNIRTALRRVAKKGDLFGPVLGPGINMEKALKNLEK